MPLCVKCRDFFHPDYSVIVDEATNACKCVFCYKEKDFVTIENEDGTGKPEKIYKREAVKNYKIYLHRLKETDKIAKLLGEFQAKQAKHNPFAI